MVRRLAIDPGDVHCGWCLGADEVDAAGTWTPSGCIDGIRRIIAIGVDEIIVEEFVLYPHEAKSQAGSAFQTSQLIGAIKVIAHDAGIPVVMQGATIKKPTRKQMKPRGIKMVPGTIHSHDAQLHWWYRTLRKKKEEELRRAQEETEVG